MYGKAGAERLVAEVCSVDRDGRQLALPVKHVASFLFTGRTSRGKKGPLSSQTQSQLRILNISRLHLHSL